MTGYLAKKTLEALFTLFVVASVIFLLMHLMVQVVIISLMQAHA
jgi:ABC-type dipeptide/oligopeptide/nickel transport system permease component